MTYKVSAYITAYKDQEAVQRCISAIEKQTYPVQKIFVVDNSPDNTIVSTLIANDDVVVLHYPENIGISGGLEKVIPSAIQNNYDFLWTFDQDSEPLPETLEVLINYYSQLKQQKKIGIIAPLPIDDQTKKELPGIVFNGYKFTPAPESQLEVDYYECDAVITSGSLVSLEAAKTVELPSKELFIDAVDWLYCLNFKKQSYSVILVKKAILKHNFGTAYQINLLFSKVAFSLYSTLRYYYIHRNQTFVELKLIQHWQYFLIFALRRWYVLVKSTAKIAMFEPEEKWLKIWACLKGTWDGLRGNLSNRW